MPKTSKSQIYAVKWLNHNGKTSNEIALELNISNEQVIKILEKNHLTNNEPKIVTASEPVTQKPLMINETAGKKNNHVMIMTESASMRYDQLKNSSTNKNKSTRYRENKNIFRPKQK